MHNGHFSVATEDVGNYLLMQCHMTLEYSFDLFWCVVTKVQPPMTVDEWALVLCIVALMDL